MKLKALFALLGCLPIVAAALQTPAASQAPQEPAALRKAPICVGGDDTAALQAMLSHGNPEMTVVEIPATPTGCLITGPLFVYSNTHVIQNGLLTLNYNWPPLVVEQRGMYSIVDHAHDVIIEGSGVLDGGDPVYTTPTSHCCMGGIVSGGPVVGSEDADVSDITVRGLTVRNIPQWGIALTNARNVRIDGVTVYNMRASSGVGFDSRDAIVTNSRFYNILDICFSMYRGVEDAIIANTIVNECQGGGLSVFSDWPACLGPPLFSRNLVLNNNIAIGQNTTGTGGIDVLGSGTAGESSESASITFSIAHSHELGGFGFAPVRGGLLSGNLTHDHGKPGGGWSNGINLLGAKGVLVSGNSTYNQGYGSTTGLGMHAGTFPASPVIPLPMCGSSVPALPAVTIERLAVLDNYYYDANPIPTMLNAFKGSATAPVVVAGNTYAPLIGVADDFVYGGSSVNTDNDAQP